MSNILKALDLLAPEITLYHKGELFHYSLISGITSLISIILIIISAIYFSKPLIWRKNPNTYIYESYTDKDTMFTINSTSFLHLITMTSYNLSDYLKFDHSSFRIIGMQISLNIYINIFNRNISKIDHWLYGPCDIYDPFDEEVINKFACIKKYYDSKKNKYYNFNDTNFQWPYMKYTQLNDGLNDYYSLVVEKCEENSLIEILGKGNHCKSDLEIDNIINNGIWILFNFVDYYVNLKDYNNPNNTYFRIIENRIQNDILSINRLNFIPMTIRTNKGYILDNFDNKMFYEFDKNDILIEENDKIYMNYNFLANNKMKYYERDYPKFQDFISDIGGFAKFISFVASIIIKFYNQYIVLKDTKSLISILYNEEKNLIKNKKIDVNNIIKVNTIRDRNNSFAKFCETNISKNEIKKEENIKPEENIAEKMKRYSTEQNVIKNNTENDNDSIFNEKNKKFHFCSFLIYKLTFYKKFKKYTIYTNFRKKIISEEQIIKNHIITYNLINATNLNNRIYSLKEMINDK